LIKKKQRTTMKWNSKRKTRTKKQRRWNRSNTKKQSIDAVLPGRKRRENKTKTKREKVYMYR